MQACLRQGDTLARLADDEFAIIQSDTAKLEAAEMLAKRIIAELGEPVDHRAWQGWPGRVVDQHQIRRSGLQGLQAAQHRLLAGRATDDQADVRNAGQAFGGERLGPFRNCHHDRICPGSGQRLGVRGRLGRLLARRPPARLRRLLRGGGLGDRLRVGAAATA